MSAAEFVFSATGATWPERHARGEVPGRWPYGLEQLDAPGRTVRFATVESPSRFRRAALRLLPSPRTRRVGLAWDEGTAHAMAASRRYGPMHCGVIWATDALDGEPAATAAVRRTLTRMRSVWVLSRGQLDAMNTLLSASTTCAFVKFGVDEQFFTPAPYPDRPLLFSAGGDRDRDHETVAAAFGRVVRARPEVRAVLQTRASIAVDGVTTVPYLTHLELREMYRQASVVAVATRPNLHVSGMTVSLEAQSTGRPAILTRTPGADDYVDDGRTGHLIGCGAVNELTDRLIEIVDDPAAAAAMGRAARRRVEDDFTTRHLADRLAQAVGL